MDMKKILTSIVLAGFCIAVSAQTMNDAMSLGSNNYYGTARTIGMGNAVTAVGGDLGSVTINPAGSAVAGYSQFTVTPGFTVSTTANSWAPSYDTKYGSQSFTHNGSSSSNRFIVPNLGLTLRFETGQKYGLKSWTFGLLSNMTNTYNEQVTAHGQNGGDGTLTSLAASFATGAQYNADGSFHMMDPSILDLTNTQRYNSQYYWNYLAAYGSGLINYNWDDGEDGMFYGINEYKDFKNGYYNYFVPGVLNQYSSRVYAGSKNDFVMNFGFNFDDNLYLGVNMDMPMFNYKYTEFFREKAVNSADFPVTPEYMFDGEWIRDGERLFESATYSYSYTSSGGGVSISGGVIWLPTSNLRLGASVKAPTIYNVTERWNVSIDTDLSEISGLDSADGYADTPTAENSYNYRSPWSFSLGMAYTFGTAGMLSVDFERMDYSVMKYSPEDSYVSYDPFYEVNRLNNLFCGASNSLRVGAEVNLLPFLSARAGFNLTSNPERFYKDNEGYTVDATYYNNNFDFYENGGAYLTDMQYVKAPIKSFSCGLGFQSAGSFFADFAVRRTNYPESYFSPYDTYILYDDGTAIAAPCVKSGRSLVDAVLTLGWRF